MKSYIFSILFLFSIVYSFASKAEFWEGAHNLRATIQRGGIDKVRKLLDSGVNPNEPIFLHVNRESRPDMNIANRIAYEQFRGSHRYSVFKSYKEYYRRGTYYDRFELTPLLFTMQFLPESKRKNEIIQLLVEYGADINVNFKLISISYRRKILDFKIHTMALAIFYKLPQNVILKMLEFGQDVTIEKGERGPLAEAVARDKDGAILRGLLSKNIDPNANTISMYLNSIGRGPIWGRFESFRRNMKMILDAGFSNYLVEDYKNILEKGFIKGFSGALSQGLLPTENDFFFGISQYVNVCDYWNPLGFKKCSEVVSTQINKMKSMGFDFSSKPYISQLLLKSNFAIADSKFHRTDMVASIALKLSLSGADPLQSSEELKDAAFYLHRITGDTVSSRKPSRIYSNDKTVAKLLENFLKKGLDPNVRSICKDRSCSLLYQFSVLSWGESMDMLLKAGADPYNGGFISHEDGSNNALSGVLSQQFTPATRKALQVLKNNGVDFNFEDRYLNKSHIYSSIDKAYNSVFDEFYPIAVDIIEDLITFEYEVLDSDVVHARQRVQDHPMFVDIVLILCKRSGFPSCSR